MNAQALSRISEGFIHMVCWTQEFGTGFLYRKPRRPFSTLGLQKATALVPIEDL